MFARRQKAFGLPGHPLDRNLKAKLYVLARSYVNKTEARKHYGRLSAKALEIFRVLLYEFHNHKSGLCFPSYDRICERAHCCRQTVADALLALERLGLIEVLNRLVRSREVDHEFNLVRTRVLRTSNAYLFRCARVNSTTGPADSSKSGYQTGTTDQVCSLPLFEALERLGKARLREKEAASRPGLSMG